MKCAWKQFLNLLPPTLRPQVDELGRERLQELRLRRAITLLTETDDSISAIATACGFSSPNYFKDVFRRVIGMPPTEYRRRALPALEETLLEEW